jgi:hypothetical protein
MHLEDHFTLIDLIHHLVNRYFSRPFPPLLHCTTFELRLRDGLHFRD